MKCIRCHRRGGIVWRSRNAGYWVVQNYRDKLDFDYARAIMSTRRMLNGFRVCWACDDYLSFTCSVMLKSPIAYIGIGGELHVAQPDDVKERIKYFAECLSDVPPAHPKVARDA